ncbi:MAG TPA: hypothetical protein DCZ95_02065 [Verrucomicrobia bacterium]|nr:MAG: hypothetical protein A2X46_00780 [Lentisphaerae bacterium GWF2_57_35]HBA82856.1 hypothetical protein [Verrucomicrobiota bacterium]
MLIGGGAVALATAIGCGSGSTAEPSALKNRRSDLDPQGVSGRTSDSGSDMKNATLLAQSSPAKDGQGTTDEWVKRQLELCRGSVLFPQWKARRSGLTKYEVTFEYTLVDGSSRIQRAGYAWEVDVSLKTVSPLRELRADEINSHSNPRVSGRHRIPVRRPTP